MNVQDLKDSFYCGLRDRIAAANPARTIVVRGVSRPAVLVAENEFPLGEDATVESFQLAWGAISRAPEGLLSVACEISYAVNGSEGSTESASSVLGRGRALAAMDAELIAALATDVRSSPGFTMAESGGVAVQTPTGTQVFWGDVSLAAAVAKSDRLTRIATVEVFGYGN